MGGKHVRQEALIGALYTVLEVLLTAHHIWRVTEGKVEPHVVELRRQERGRRVGVDRAHAVGKKAVGSAPNQHIARLQPDVLLLAASELVAELTCVPCT